MSVSDTIDTKTLRILADRIEANEIKALSIRQPWPHRIFNEGKDVENRSWATKHRGFFIVHAGVSQRELHKCDGAGMDLPRGGIVGIARIVDCVSEMDSRWFCGPFGFVLRDAVPVDLIPCTGWLGFFRPDPAACAALAAALREKAKVFA